MFVVDASVVLAWCFADETSRAAQAALARLEDEPAMAPAIWPLEVANGLRTAERRGRLTAADLGRLRELLLALPISVEPVGLAETLGEVTDLARTFDLTAYDASYLALAARRGLAIATIDERLAAACTVVGVALVG